MSLSTTSTPRNRGTAGAAPDEDGDNPPRGSPHCPLCQSKRRDYLFVMGQSRMTRCHECGLIFRTETHGKGTHGAAASYALEPEVEALLRNELKVSGTVNRALQVVSSGHSSGRLGEDSRLELTTVGLPADHKVLETLQPGSLDAAFLNGVLEQAVNPLEVLRLIRRALKPSGSLTILVDGGPFDRLPSDESRLPRHVYAPHVLIRLLNTAGFTCEQCGLLQKRFGVAHQDDRLLVDDRFPAVHKMLTQFQEPTEVGTGLLHARAVARDPPARPRVSIIMPVFNEGLTFRETFDRVYAATIHGAEREIVIVESNSTDGSREAVREVEHMPGVRVIYEDQPRGKGHAVRAGFAAATGDVFLIQDADSEYDVADYDIVLEPVLRLSATFVLGSRHMGGRTWKIRQFEGSESLAATMNLAHEGFTFLCNFMYGTEMRDPTTMYKVFRRECIQGVTFRRNRFDFDWELVCKLVRRGHVPVEVPINYRSRSYAEGKKVRFFRDPLTWLNTIVRSRFESLS